LPTLEAGMIAALAGTVEALPEGKEAPFICMCLPGMDGAGLLTII